MRNTQTKSEIAIRCEAARVALKSMRFILPSRKRKANEIVAELLTIQNLLTQK